MFYVLSDHLRSTSVLVNQNGTVNSRNFYYPYGGNRGGSAFSAITTKRFTGQYHEQGLPGDEGRSYYNARWYDAQVGMFISADTLVPSPLTPQTLNRYAYSNNNPLRYQDPSGHRACEDDDCLRSGPVIIKPPKTSGHSDPRDLTQWLVAEANQLASLPEGRAIRSELLSNKGPGFSSLRVVLAFYRFYQLARDGASLDFKDKTKLTLGKTIQLSGIWFEWSTPGNMLYGFYGTAWGVPHDLLHLGASYAQVADHIRNPAESSLGPPATMFDTLEDYVAIDFGITLYYQAYLPDQKVTQEEFAALLVNYAYLTLLAQEPAPLDQMSNPDWPYEAGYFDNDLNPPSPPGEFPSFPRGDKETR